MKSEEQSSLREKSAHHNYFKVLLNPVLTKIDVNISDFIIAVGVVLDVSAKSEYHVTAIQRVIVASFVLN